LSVNSCPSGTVFDSTLKICNFPSQVVTYAPFTSCASADLTAVPNDNTKFYRCSSGSLIVFSCPSGTIFDSVNKICNYGSSIIVTVPASTTTAAPITTVSQTCTVSQDRTAIDCTSYYTCPNGILGISTCASGLVFDAINKVCNIPSNVYGSCGTASATSKYKKKHLKLAKKNYQYFYSN
jgi:hypothetical protein